jgi:hypothetical protein
MASMIFALLKTDYETSNQVPSGQEPPLPMLYDPVIHRKHQEGHYRSLKPGTSPERSFNFHTLANPLYPMELAQITPLLLGVAFGC